MVNFQLLTKGRALILKTVKKSIFNKEIWKEKVMVESYQLPKYIYKWNHNHLTPMRGY